MLTPALFVLCVKNVSLKRFDVKHNYHKYYRLSRPSLQEMTSALRGPLLTIAVRTFHLKFGHGLERFSTKSRLWLSLKGFAQLLEFVVREQDCVISDLGLTVD